MVSEPQPVQLQRTSERRTRRTPFHYPERRTGFDRRRAPGWRGKYLSDLRHLAERPRVVLLVLATIIVFNFMDLVLTLRVLHAGGTELNPVMARLFEIGPYTAAAVKLGLVGGGVLVLLALRRYRRALELSLVVLVFFSALMIYHVALAAQLLA